MSTKSTKDAKNWFGRRPGRFDRSAFVLFVSFVDNRKVAFAAPAAGGRSPAGYRLAMSPGVGLRSQTDAVTTGDFCTEPITSAIGWHWWFQQIV